MSQWKASQGGNPWTREDLQKVRKARREIRSSQKARGYQLTRKSYIYRVTVDVIRVPDWIWTKRLKDLDSTLDYVWLKDRVIANILRRMDAEEGGHPEITRIEARRCQICGILRLNLLAEQRRKIDETTMRGRQLPCGPECMTRYHQQRGNL